MIERTSWVAAAVMMARGESVGADAAAEAGGVCRGGRGGVPLRGVQTDERWNTRRGEGCKRAQCPYERVPSSGTWEEEAAGARALSDLGLATWVRSGIWEEPLGSRRPPWTSEVGRKELGDVERLEDTVVLDDVDAWGEGEGDGARLRDRKCHRLRVMP